MINSHQSKFPSIYLCTLADDIFLTHKQNKGKPNKNRGVPNYRAVVPEFKTNSPQKTEEKKIN